MTLFRYVMAIAVGLLSLSAASAQIQLSDSQFDSGSQPMEGAQYRLSGTAGRALVGNGNRLSLRVPLMIPLMPRDTAGDVDGDGALTFQDALTVLQFVLGFAVPTGAQAAIADVDGDGQMTIGDAIKIMRVAQGLETLSKPVVALVDPQLMEEYRSADAVRVVRVAFGSGVSGGNLQVILENEGRVEVMGLSEDALLSVTEERPGVVRVAFAQVGTAHEEVGLRVVLPGLGDAESTQLRVNGNLYDALGHPVEQMQVEWTVDPLAPRDFALLQNVPNPFNPATTIRYELPVAGLVTLNLYDVKGQLVRHLISKQMDSGRYDIVWDGHDASGHQVASGIYFYRMSVGNGRFSAVRRMVLLK